MGQNNFADVRAHPQIIIFHSVMLTNTQVTPANLFLFELYHESGILHFEVDHPGTPKPLSGKSKSSGFLRKSIFSTFFLVFWGPKTLFFDPNTFVGLRNPTFGGVKLLKLFDLSNSF